MSKRNRKRAGRGLRGQAQACEGGSPGRGSSIWKHPRQDADVPAAGWALPAGSCSSSDPQAVPLRRHPSHPFPPLFSLFPNPLLPSLFGLERATLSPHCCVSHPFCPLHLVPFPFPSLTFVLSLSLPPLYLRPAPLLPFLSPSLPL